jgi:hypothetical protein
MKPPYPKLILWILLGIPHFLDAQSPGGVSTNLSLWVKAESALPAGGGTLTKWTDQTGINTFTKSGSGITTVTNIINFHPVVRFTGVGTLQGNTSINWSECTAVAGWTGSAAAERGTVISPTTNGTAPNDASRYYFRAGVESSAFLYAGMGTDSIGFMYMAAPPAATSNPPENIYTASGVGNVFTKNGVNDTIGSLYGGFTKRATVMTAPPQIGDRSTNDSKMNGDIAEIIVYSSNNAANRNKVESYLALKYGLTLGNNTSTVNYTSSANKVFWAGVSKYQHNIFGIGSDQASGLTQITSNSMNSGSGNGAGQNKLGNLILTAGSLSNQQFLMIGTDSTSLGEQTISAAAANGPAATYGSKRLTRTWLVQNTGSVGAVTMSFDKTGLTLSGGNTATNYYLMIDNDGDGNFTTGTQSFYGTSSLVAPLVTFSGITLRNNVIFTIITLPMTAIPLAVDWESFTATVVGNTTGSAAGNTSGGAAADANTVSLQWTVADAMDIDHFEVERSTDAINFTTTGSIPANAGSAGSGSNPTGSNAAGSSPTSGSRSWSFREQPPPDTYYYRIRVIGRDGSYHLSIVRSVVVPGAGQASFLRIRSNPVRNNQLQLRIDWPQKNTIFIRIADRQGNILFQKERALQPGNNDETINLGACTGGLYFVQIQSGNERYALPFLK